MKKGINDNRSVEKKAEDAGEAITKGVKGGADKIKKGIEKEKDKIFSDWRNAKFEESVADATKQGRSVLSRAEALACSGLPGGCSGKPTNARPCTPANGAVACACEL